MDYKGILVVSFGSSNEGAIKEAIEAVERRIGKEFSQWDIRRAFTSQAIIRKVKARSGVKIDTAEEALENMLKDGIREVVIQPLHIVPGIEYEGIVETVEKYADSFEKIILGRPILYDNKDYKIAIEALKIQIPSMKEDEAVVLVGHGTKHPSNYHYEKLRDELYIENSKIYLGTLEEDPNVYDVISRLKESNIRKINLMPYMLVCGGHGEKDIAGEKEDSWKSILEREGFEVSTYLHGLGENVEYQKIYVQHIRDAISMKR